MRQALKTLTLTALPLTLGTAANAVNHMIDCAFLGRFSETALAASLPGNMLGMFFTGFLICTIGYTSTLVAQSHGAKRHDLAWAAFVQGLYLTLYAAPLFLLVIPAGNLIVSLAGHSSALAAQELIAFRYAVAAGFATVVTTVLSCYFTGRGKTRIVGFAITGGCLLNIALDPLFIFKLNMGISGAGLASLLSSSAVGLVIALALLRDPDVRLHLRKGTLDFNSRLAARIVRFGSPFGFSAIVGSGAFVIFVMALGHLSSSALAVGNACFAINNIFYAILCTIESAVSILVGQAFGKGDIPALRRIVIAGHLLALLLLLAFYTPILFAPSFAFSLFSGHNASIDTTFRSYQTGFLTILLAREIFEALQHVVTGALHGIGETRTIFKLHLIASLLVQLPLVALVIFLVPEPLVLWATMPLAFAIHAFLLLRNWKVINLQPRNTTRLYPSSHPEAATYSSMSATSVMAEARLSRVRQQSKWYLS